MAEELTNIELHKIVKAKLEAVALQLNKQLYRAHYLLWLKHKTVRHCSQNEINIIINTSVLMLQFKNCSDHISGCKLSRIIFISVSHIMVFGQFL